MATPTPWAQEPGEDNLVYVQRFINTHYIPSFNPHINAPTNQTVKDVRSHFETVIYGNLPQLLTQYPNEILKLIHTLAHDPFISPRDPANGPCFDAICDVILALFKLPADQRDDVLTTLKSEQICLLEIIQRCFCSTLYPSNEWLATPEAAKQNNTAASAPKGQPSFLLSRRQLKDKQSGLQRLMVSSAVRAYLSTLWNVQLLHALYDIEYPLACVAVEQQMNKDDTNNNNSSNNNISTNSLEDNNNTRIVTTNTNTNQSAQNTNPPSPPSNGMIVLMNRIDICIRFAALWAGATPNRTPPTLEAETALKFITVFTPDILTLFTLPNDIKANLLSMFYVFYDMLVTHITIHFLTPLPPGMLEILQASQHQQQPTTTNEQTDDSLLICFENTYDDEIEIVTHITTQGIISSQQQEQEQTQAQQTKDNYIQWQFVLNAALLAFTHPAFLPSKLVQGGSTSGFKNLRDTVIAITPWHCFEWTIALLQGVIQCPHTSLAPPISTTSLNLVQPQVMIKIIQWFSDLHYAPGLSYEQGQQMISQPRHVEFIPQNKGSAERIIFVSRKSPNANPVINIDKFLKLLVSFILHHYIPQEQYFDVYFNMKDTQQQRQQTKENNNLIIQIIFELLTHYQRYDWHPQVNSAILFTTMETYLHIHPNQQTVKVVQLFLDTFFKHNDYLDVFTKRQDDRCGDNNNNNNGNNNSTDQETTVDYIKRLLSAGSSQQQQQQQKQQGQDQDQTNNTTATTPSIAYQYTGLEQRIDDEIAAAIASIPYQKASTTTTGGAGGGAASRFGNKTATSPRNNMGTASALSSSTPSPTQIANKATYRPIVQCLFDGLIDRNPITRLRALLALNGMVIVPPRADNEALSLSSPNPTTTSPVADLEKVTFIIELFSEMNIMQNLLSFATLSYNGLDTVLYPSEKSKNNVITITRSFLGHLLTQLCFHKKTKQLIQPKTMLHHTGLLTTLQFLCQADGVNHSLIRGYSPIYENWNKEQFVLFYQQLYDIVFIENILLLQQPQQQNNNNNTNNDNNSQPPSLLEQITSAVGVLGSIVDLTQQDQTNDNDNDNGDRLQESHRNNTSIARRYIYETFHKVVTENANNNNNINNNNENDNINNNNENDKNELQLLIYQTLCNLFTPEQFSTKFLDNMTFKNLGLFNQTASSTTKGGNTDINSPPTQNFISGCYLLQFVVDNIQDQRGVLYTLFQQTLLQLSNNNNNNNNTIELTKLLITTQCNILKTIQQVFIFAQQPSYYQILTNVFENNILKPSLYGGLSGQYVINLTLTIDHIITTLSSSTASLQLIPDNNHNIDNNTNPSSLISLLFTHYLALCRTIRYHQSFSSLERWAEIVMNQDEVDGMFFLDNTNNNNNNNNNYDPKIAESYYKLWSHAVGATKSKGNNNNNGNNMKSSSGSPKGSLFGSLFSCIQ